jgi:hypothetical protein
MTQTITKKRTSSPIYLDIGDDVFDSPRSVDVLPRTHTDSSGVTGEQWNH